MTDRTASFVHAVDEEADILAGIEPALPSPASYWTIERARTAEPRGSYVPANSNRRSVAMHGRTWIWRAVAALTVALLSALILWAGFVERVSLLTEGAAIAAMPWGLVTLADLYAGFFLFAGLIVMAERRLWVGLAWAAPILLLGNLWSAIWILWRAPILARRLRGR